MERERERENQRVMDDEVIEYSSDGEFLFSGPTRSDYLEVVDSEFPRQIQNHPFHPSHPLFLVKRKDSYQNECDSCEKDCGQGIFFYRCDLCDFDLDTNCAKLTPPTTKYLGHPDHLLSLYNDEVIEYSSDGELMFSGPSRSDYLVVVDSEFPRQIQNHPFHPSHPLFLVKRKDSYQNECDSCEKDCGQGIFFYRCDLCDFDLDTNCAKLTPPTTKYLGHPDHLLSLYNLDYSSVDLYYPCKACKQKCGGHVLSCAPCNFNLHVDCLPHKVKHKNHRHFFTPMACIEEADRGINELVCYECDAKINPDEPVYYCAKCYFPLHIACSSEAIADHDESGQLLVGVGEAMTELRMDVRVETTKLNKQKQKVSQLQARIRILERETQHKETSTKFPLKIKHPFHSQHPLTLTLGQGDSKCYYCSVCKKPIDGFRYTCSDCYFFIDLNCVLRKPTIKYDGHQEHLLIFLKRNYGNYNRCNACRQFCKTSPILRCADCKFNLHIDCFPSLPPTFKNPQCHFHTLTLTNSSALDLSADEFYCDFCEDERDPKLPFYYCEECSFFAHVTCVLYEELPSILAELDGTKRDDGVVEECVFVDVSNDKIDDEDPTLAKIDAEHRELQLKSEELEEKLGEIKVKQKELDDKRAQYLASVS